MKKKCRFLGFIACSTCIFLGFGQGKVGNSLREKTAYQTSSPWMPEIDIRADVAIVYGVHGNPTDGEQELTFEERLNSWRERDYNTHFMTGIAWGSYQDYFLGEWDGKNHLYLPSKPNDVQLTHAKGETLAEVKSEWNPGSNTQYLSFDNDPEGIRVEVTW